MVLNRGRDVPISIPEEASTVDDDEIGASGRVGFAAACTVCCVAPVLVIAGVVSLAALAAIGITLAAIVLVGGALHLFRRDRLPPLGPGGRAGLAALGVVLAATGLVVAGSAGRPLVAAGVATLAVAATFALGAARTTAT